MKVLRISAGLLLASLVLAGCATGDASSGEDGTAGPSPSTTAGPTPDETDAGSPGLDELTVSAGGLGPIRIGEPLAGAATRMAQQTDEDCTTTYWRTAPEYASPGGGYGRGGGDAFTVWGDADTGAIARIDVLAPEIATADGVRIGMSAVELETIHPDAERRAATLSTLWILPGGQDEANGQLVIEAAGPDEAYWGSARETVVHLRVLPFDAEPRAIAGTDDVVGACLDPF